MTVLILFHHKTYCYSIDKFTHVTLAHSTDNQLKDLEVIEGGGGVGGWGGRAHNSVG